MKVFKKPAATSFDRQQDGGLAVGRPIVWAVAKQHASRGGQKTDVKKIDTVKISGLFSVKIGMCMHWWFNRNPFYGIFL